MRTRLLIGAAAVACTLAALPTHSATLTLGGGWEPIFYSNPVSGSAFGGPIYDYYTGDTDFTFTLTSNADLNITDAFYNLDIYDLVINGVDQGPTSTPLQDFAYTDDFDVAFADRHFSHGSYALGPGTYDVVGTAIYSPYGIGVGAIELAVPEPAAWTLMLVGFGALGCVLRRRARRGAVAA